MKNCKSLIHGKKTVYNCWYVSKMKNCQVWRAGKQDKQIILLIHYNKMKICEAQTRIH
jgi:hypothetical protein